MYGGVHSCSAQRALFLDRGTRIMALILAAASDEFWQSYRHDLSDLTGEQHWPPLDEIYVQVDAMCPEDIAEGAGIPSCSWIGARVFVSYKDQKPISCEMTVPELYGSTEIRSLTRGSTPEQALALIDIASTLPEVMQDDYELRILSIPGLLLEAFRLRSLTGKRDLIMPLVVLNPRLKDKIAFPVDEFFEILHPYALKRLRFDESPGDSSQQSKEAEPRDRSKGP